MSAETPQPQESIFSFWRRGLVSDREKNKLSTPLLGFLREHEIHIHTKYFPLIYQYFQGQDVVVQLGKNPQRPFYLVDPLILKKRLDEVEQAVLFAREEIHQERTEEERQYFQEKILQVKDGKNNYQPITVEQARKEIFDFSVGSFRVLGPEAEKVVQRLVNRAEIYLSGRLGDFEHFDQFKLTALRIMMRNAHRDEFSRQAHKAKREATPQITILPSSRVHILKREDVPDFNQLDPEDQAMIRLREQGVYTFEDISKLLQVEFRVYWSANTLRQRYTRLYHAYLPSEENIHAVS